MSERWGPGNKDKDPSFETGHLDDGTPYELIFGEHPHSRSDNNIYARFKEPMGSERESIVGFDGHRILVRIELRTMNYLKTSYLSLRIRQKLYQLMDLPVALWKGETPEGRKVYWRQTPAIITRWLPDQGCVILEADGVDYFPPSPWDEAQEAEKTIKDDILTPSIWWWRK